MRARSPQLQPCRHATVIKLIVCAAAVFGTAPQPVDGCNGALIDPEGCGDDDFICTNTVFGPDSRAKCPILCNSCVTTTATTTAVARVCNEKPDPDDCGADASVCSDAEFKLAQSAATAEFLAADTGGDGFLSATEISEIEGFNTILESDGTERPATEEEKKDLVAMILDADGDGDGKLSLEENLARYLWPDNNYTARCPVLCNTCIKLGVTSDVGDHDAGEVAIGDAGDAGEVGGAGDASEAISAGPASIAIAVVDKGLGGCQYSEYTQELQPGSGGGSACSACEGDCDSDEECADGLVCFQRGATELVPGCSTNISDYVSTHDYCTSFGYYGGIMNISGDCDSSSPNCATSAGVRNTGNACNISVTPGSRIAVQSFETDPLYDTLTVDGVDFAGYDSSGLDGLIASNGTIAWTSGSFSSFKSAGWEICFCPPDVNSSSCTPPQTQYDMQLSYAGLSVTVTSGSCQISESEDSQDEKYDAGICVTSPNYPETYELGGDCTIEASPGSYIMTAVERTYEGDDLVVNGREYDERIGRGGCKWNNT